MGVIPGIQLYDVIGSPAAIDEILFVPALFDFTGGLQGPAEFPLMECSRHWARVRKVLRRFAGFLGPFPLVRAWVRARIAAVFGFSIPLSWDEYRYRLFDSPFLAIIRGDESPLCTAVPFFCTDAQAKGPALIFRRSEKDCLLREKVTLAFWSLLLRQPYDLQPFDDQTFEDEVAWVAWGYQRGEFYYCEVEDDSHLVLFPVLTCPRCGGSGEESFFPAGDMCESCEGIGHYT